METSDKLLVTCANCGTANRVPRERLGDVAARVSGAMDARSLSGWLARELGA